ncbi:MAG: hypothetical protein K0R00_54 [Herbinix sp.]|nr:hypothetical protein [Herbinix sp.]
MKTIKTIIAFLKIIGKVLFSTREEKENMKSVLKAYNDAVQSYMKENNVSREVAEDEMNARLQREAMKMENKTRA